MRCRCRRAFLTQPGPSTGPMQCSIKRSKGLYPSYMLYLDVGHKFLLHARKRKKSKASSYVMSLDERVALLHAPLLHLPEGHMRNPDWTRQ